MTHTHTHTLYKNIVTNKLYGNKVKKNTSNVTYNSVAKTKWMKESKCATDTHN